MCTLIVAWRAFEAAPVCVAANRDEFRDRPSSPPAVRGSDPRVLAPRDERAGGTWIGYNDRGVLVAVTNRWVEGDGDRSRGLLVEDALGEPTADAAVDRVEAELEDREYAPFHLVVADAAACRLVEHGRNVPGDSAVTALEPGVHAVVNVGYDGEWFVPEARPEAGRTQARNAERVRAELQPRDDETAAEWTRRGGAVLGDHEFGVCVHRGRFGTRSSSLVRLGDDAVYEFADGPPCETPYRPTEETI